MKYDPQKHRRRSIRLKGYDYAQLGGYFVTICTYQRECLFGEVVDDQMVLNPSGEIVQHAWDDLPNHYAHVELDQFCIMPNHVHGIIILTDLPPHMDATSRRGGSQTRPYTTRTKRHGLPEIVRAFKSFSSRRINELLDSQGVPTWQRNYYDHIVRNERELNAIRQYILANPLNWQLDQDNPTNLSRINQR